MVLGISKARLEVFHPDSPHNYPDEVIHGNRARDDSDLISVSGGLRISKRKDEGKMTAWNDDGQYTQPDGRPLVHSGDRIDWYVRHEGESEPKRRWVVMVRDVDRERGGPNSSKIEWSVEDYAFSIMSKRRVYNNFENVRIAGTEDAILNTVMRNEAPEISRELIGDGNGEITSINCDGTNLFDLAKTLARRAGCHMRSEGTGIRFEQPQNFERYVPEKRDLSNIKGTDTDDGMVNSVRVAGGQGRDDDDEQLSQTGYVEFSQNDPVTFQVSTRKATLDRIQLWMHRQETGGKVRVRVQKANDAGTGPVEIGDPNSDITNLERDSRFIDKDGWTPFNLENEILPEPNPWIIVETDNDESVQELGVNDAGRPAYIAEYPYPVLVRNGDFESISRYRRREETKNRSDAQTEEEALEVAREVINHDAAPERKVTFEAVGVEPHQYRPGDILEMDYWREGVVGDYMITERSDSYDGIKLTADFAAQEVTTI